ncbi:hypothetical protein SARC_08943 [Sphaeroforma arctica JP610]|uniref:Uncharacterized protein n=1 Tax=Sphaeroforma arctica JP610 TaxID=667725 RepID=A0A0L0FPA2_9EUKA|nr:hypothetical protein SARC_08943 [Sphaeroforma arctica JP610]KNC78635.1 hypothetical protein SARC_08943 [Sphaeroforma arctica JP610]|eukprot:XP_014152537.1 hypothetical protein SARC_08943 [Sphaeroforma arctica JP610]
MMVGKGKWAGTGGVQGAPQGGEGDSEKPRHYMYTNRQVFDGKRMRKAVQRHTVDYFNTCTRYLEARLWKKDVRRDLLHLQPDANYTREILPPYAMQSTPVNAVTTKLAHTSTNKVRRPTFTCTWTPEGRRLITGSSSGEFTLWNGLTFNFETILQAHDQAVRAMMWSHNDSWLVTGDHGGVVKYWQANMNNVKEFTAHRDAIRGMAFSPNDSKFVTGGDDSLLKIWDFATGTEEQTLTGHGWDVKCLDWHPQKGLVVSGSKDNNVKFWDPRTGTNVHTVHPHKDTILDTKFNRNGNWLLTCSRDQLAKVYDMRTLRELDSFKGHRKEVNTVAWHPVHERLFASGCAEGSIFYWLVGNEKEAGSSINAHESNIWDLAWHPMGHMLASASNDHSTKFWTRSPLGSLGTDEEFGVVRTNVPMSSGDTQMSIPGLGGGKDAYGAHPKLSMAGSTGPRGGGFNKPRAPFNSNNNNTNTGNPNSSGAPPINGGRGYDNPNFMGGYRPPSSNVRPNGSDYRPPANQNRPMGSDYRPPANQNRAMGSDFRPPTNQNRPPMRHPNMGGSGPPPMGPPPTGGPPTGGPPQGPSGGPSGPPPQWNASQDRNQMMGNRPPNQMQGNRPSNRPPYNNNNNNNNMSGGYQPQQGFSGQGLPPSHGHYMHQAQDRGPPRPSNAGPPNGAPSNGPASGPPSGGPPNGQDPYVHPQRQQSMRPSQGDGQNRGQPNRGRPY